MGSLVLLGILCFIYSGSCRPNGAPTDSCFYMTPRHIHPHTHRKVYPTKANGLYNITTSSDVFRPDRPLRVTLWGPPFKGFLLVAAEEGSKDWPAGVFYSDDGSSKRKSCLGGGDTITHTNNSYKDSVSILWYGPENPHSEQVQFIATVVVNMTIYYTDIKSTFLRMDPTVAASRQGGDGGVMGPMADPWLLGQENANDPWGTGTGSSWGTGTGTGRSWGTGTGTGSSWGTGTGSSWGTGTGSSWGTGTGTGSSWGTGTGSSWGTGSGTGSGNNVWDSSAGNNWKSQSGTAGWNAGQGQQQGSSGSTTWQSAGGSGQQQWGWDRSQQSQTTASSWGAHAGSWGATTTQATKAAQGSAAGQSQTGTGTASGTGTSGAGTQTGTGTGAAADTKSTLSIDWIKNIPTKTWYEILKRLGFGISTPTAADTSSGGNQAGNQAGNRAGNQAATGMK